MAGKLIVIAGTNASGKSGLGVALAKKYGGEVVSHTRNVTSMQDTIVRLMQAEEELNREIDRLVDLKAEIAGVISQVRNESYRLILEKRYLCFQTWAQIGADLHYTRRWLLTKHDRAVDVVEKLISGREAGA